MLVLAALAVGGLAAEPWPSGDLEFHTAWPQLNRLEAFPLDAAERAGSYVTLEAEVSGTDVGRRPHPWNGVKVMLKIDTPDGSVWPQLALPEGTFGPQTFRRRLYVPSDVTGLTLILGLEEVPGTVSIRNVRLDPAGRPPEAAPADNTRRIDPGHPGRLRGAMVAPSVTLDDLKVLAGWGANLIRWQLVRPARQPHTLDAWNRWASETVRHTDEVLGWAAGLGLKVAVDLHSPPGGDDTIGGYQGALGGLFTEPWAQDRFTSFWVELAQRYRGNPAVWGFDLANEPDDEGVDLAACLDWQALAERTARAIRAADPDRILIVQPADWGGPRGFLRFRPLSVDRVVYSFHDYAPMEFTHQGVFQPAWPTVYPGPIAGTLWDRAALSRTLEPARAFARKYRVPLYVGEFGAVRWAPGAERWFADQISLFEAEGWDWSYHAFREWDGWNVEVGPPERLAVVKRALSREVP